MDLEYLQKQISAIQLVPQTIAGIAQYCILNSRESQKKIAAIIDKQFNKEFYIQRRLAILYLISEILLRTGTGEKKDDRFFKPLAPKIRVYIEEISRRFKQLKPQQIQIVPNILNSWSIPGQQIFSANFMEKLRKTAEPIIMAAQKNEQQRKNNIFINYSKTFLMQYEDMIAYEPVRIIYDNGVAYDKVNQQVKQITRQMGKLTGDSMTPEKIERATQLRVQLQKLSEKLFDIVCRCHVNFKILRQACKEQVERLPQEAKEVMEKL